MKKLPWKWFDHRTDLPQWLLSGVGQIVVEWAFLERELEEFIRLLMDGSIRLGRIMSKGMNAKTRVTVATNLMQGLVYDSKLKPEMLSDFLKLGNKITETTQGKRDMVAHGLWDRRRGEWRVLRLAAARPVPQLRPDLKKLSRAVVPQSEIVTRAKLAEISEAIITDAKALDSFCQRLNAALAPLRHTPPQYSRRRRRPRKGQTRSAQP
jgi:hypothetical protein